MSKIYFRSGKPDMCLTSDLEKNAAGTKQRIWDFVADNYPNYSTSNIIARADDLQKILDGEKEEVGDAAYHLKIWLTGGGANVQAEYDRTHREIYETAIAEFLRRNTPAAVEKCETAKLEVMTQELTIDWND